ncbi:MAG TPA: TIGR02206 family membrane protein [Nocardioidaceae bacterium]|nr:TIGR02206 family membrane protein [Nocardioidaceae bacterium]
MTTRAVRSAADDFQSFTPTHFLLMGLFCVGALAVVVWGRRHRGTANELRDRRLFAIAVPLFAVPMQIYQFTPQAWDLGTSLPIQLCDLSWMTATWALWTRHPWATALTYYWGLSITTQAIITPSLGQNFPDPRFFGFWGMHFLIVWAAVYLTWGLGIRPTWASYRVAIVATAIWAVAVFTFNEIADTNYGYLNEKPSSTSLLTVLGPWPWYVFAEIAIVFVGWAVVMTWPWTRAARRPAPELSQK